jgi:type IV pilus assembly protein PilA
MIVVAMVGVLAALAMVGYRRYIDSSKIVEPQHVAQGIRGAEEQYRAEFLSYLDVSTGNYFPQNIGAAGSFDSRKFAWPPAAHPDLVAWNTLGVVTDGPVWFGYKVNAGAAQQAVGVGISSALPAAMVPAWPPAPTDPWYVIQAEGNPGRSPGDPATTNTVLIGSSFTGELIWNQP